MFAIKKHFLLTQKGSIMTTFAIFIFVVLIGVILYFMFMNFSYSSKLESGGEDSAFNKKLTSIFNSLLGDKKDVLPSTSNNTRRKKTLSCMSVGVVSSSYDSKKGLILSLNTDFEDETATLVINIADSKGIEINDEIPLIFENKNYSLNTSLLSNSSRYKNLTKPLDVQLNIDGCREYSFVTIK